MASFRWSSQRAKFLSVLTAGKAQRAQTLLSPTSGATNVTALFLGRLLNRTRASASCIAEEDP